MRDALHSNHGGGYSYRLAPANGPLNEETFGKIPLKFVGKQGLRWSGGPAHGGKEIWFNGTYVTEGTTPKGSMWSRCPIPRNDMRQTGVGFAPPCMQFGMPATMCQGMQDGEGGAEPTLEIVDRVLIPADLPAGEYVLGWRWCVRRARARPSAIDLRRSSVCRSSAAHRCNR
jgi:hypothetical protein